MLHKGLLKSGSCAGHFLLQVLERVPRELRAVAPARQHTASGNLCDFLRIVVGIDRAHRGNLGLERIEMNLGCCGA